MDNQPVILPIRLQPSNLRPIAYRILSKKHGLNIKSEALKILSDYIGPKFGNEWKSAKSQYFIEEIAKIWKEQDRGLFIDGDGLNDVIKEIDSLNSSLPKTRNTLESVQNNNNQGGQGQGQGQGQVSVDSMIAGRRDTVVDEVMVSEDEEAINNRTSPPTSISPQPIRNTIDWREYFRIIDAFQQPLFDYNHHRKQYEPSKTKDSSFQSTSIDANIGLFQKRFHIVKDRLLRNENFQSNSFNAFSSVANDQDGTNSITQVKNLLGRNNQRFMLFGMLTLMNGEWYLQDNSDKIQLDINQADPNLGSYYVPGNMVLCDGIHSNGKFYCSSIGHPPGERRTDTLEAIGNLDFLGIHANMRIDRELHTRLKLLERELDHKIIILGANCYLDDLKTLDALTKLFTRLSEDENDLPISIIFNGSFTSSPKHTSEYKNLFDSLASILEKFPVISGRINLVFIPGENDLWQAPLWPKHPIPKLFGNRITRVARSVNWSSNPTRMVYLSQEIVIARDDIGGRFRRNTVLFPQLSKDSDEEDEDEYDERRTEIEKLESLPPKVSEARKVVKTVLDQGHLSPFTKNLKPVIWHLDHTLHLSPLPTVLILTDPTSPAFDVTYNGCKCLNPGILIQKRKLNYIEYNLNSKRSEIKELHF
ncbi:DNA polymerase epsilon subunit B [Wickerhamomyces ciferrii]|uniref:DNA polymerase epsilon subunit B n=1 Tax=Wickerhamomyces ciferrii (strain ATCC 14091 / BCRC 22168 / CBS 111 / JCM 3599 / NBRC 0793 / NRRL Y-1031 F-60-10) TaxID=1206466 RepID=K0KMQ1_WICCF|nr:DNA polymerase epsilon subunit B [Wickerhamomyces ciferrii]CCH42644.1 DNA polymerase epsilon subunit B [Wickerhamomyces ciferrii]